jgi:hypothetical protein
MFDSLAARCVADAFHPRITERCYNFSVVVSVGTRTNGRRPNTDASFTNRQLNGETDDVEGFQRITS